MNRRTSKQASTRLPNNERFTSSGFILAAIGSSVGLGNMWKFPYITGQHGGAAFFLLFIVCLLIVGSRRWRSDAAGGATPPVPCTN
jgi:NSS family neurotransmitter:Na+ symporter